MSPAASRLAHLRTWIRRHTTATVLLIALCALGVWVFAEVADEVVEGESRALDRKIFLALRNAQGEPLGPAWFEEFMRDITALGSTGVLTGMVLFSAGFLWLDRRRAVALFLVASTVLGSSMSYLLKTLFARPRPDLFTPSVEVFTHSFPSGHSAMSAMIFLTLGVMLCRVQQTFRTKVYLIAIATFSAAMVGFSRVYLGVHWPTDVVAGWSFGAAWAAGSWLLFDLLDEHSRRDLDAPDAAA